MLHFVDQNPMLCVLTQHCIKHTYNITVLFICVDAEEGQGLAFPSHILLSLAFTVSLRLCYIAGLVLRPHGNVEHPNTPPPPGLLHLLACGSYAPRAGRIQSGPSQAPFTHAPLPPGEHPCFPGGRAEGSGEEEEEGGVSFAVPGPCRPAGKVELRGHERVVGAGRGMAV